MNNYRVLLRGLVELLDVSIPVRTDNDPSIDEEPLEWEVCHADVLSRLLYMRAPFQNPHTYCVDYGVPRINFYVPIPCLPSHHLSLTVFDCPEYMAIVDVDLGTLEDIATGRRIFSAPGNVRGKCHWFPYTTERFGNEHIS